GERIRALLAQPRYSGLRLADQVALLAALADGVLDAFPVAIIPDLRARLAGWLDAHAGEAVAELARSGELTDETRAALVAALRTLAEELAPANDTEGAS
ncbi:MAG: F0F1 ATP synthase subunit alpha, partial [Sphingomonadales bacterium]|nr:F0F1 ATP synthase subunit alpha [Sphingomonadales bacterium]